MNARTLLGKLRGLGVKLTADGDRLHVDAPAGSITDHIRAALVENKPRLLRLLELEQRKVREANRRGLVIQWAKEPGWIALHDPTAGEWHEVRASECLPGVVNSANARRKSSQSSDQKRGEQKEVTQQG
jgi:hypothetical protein